MVVLASVSCSEGATAPKTPNGIAAATALTATGTVGAPLVPAPAVRVTNPTSGSPVAGVAVTFVVTAGGGSVGSSTVTTGSDGVATAAWTLGHTVGTNTLTASATGLTGSPVTFTATTSAGPASALVSSTGNGQSAAVGTAVAVPPAVMVTDSYGNPVSGATVTFSVASGGGTVTGGTATSDASGVARVGSWVLGKSAGANTLTATANGLTGSPVTFTATGTAGAAAAIAMSAGDAQTAAVTTAVTIAPAVKVTDANGNPVGGTTVTFAVTSGGGSVTGGVATSDATGLAKVGSWVLGRVAGANGLTATAAGLTGSPVAFSATATAGPAATIAASAGANQTATAGTAVAVPPAVKVTDSYGNVVGGTTVTFAVSSGGGSVTGGTATTDATGVATVGSWVLGKTAGANTLAATSTGLAGSPVTFTATGTAGAAAKIVMKGGNNQVATIGTAVSVVPSVEVTDANGNAVRGSAVTFAVVGAGGTITGGAATTDASGVAKVGSWVLASTAGVDTLDATATGLSGSPVVFTDTATTRAASAYVVTTSSTSPIAGGTAAISAQLVDGNGAAFHQSGRLVTWSVSGSGATPSTATSTTDVNGLATVTLAIGSTVGASYTVKATDNASLTGTSPVMTTSQGTLSTVTATGARYTIIDSAGTTKPSFSATNQFGATITNPTLTYRARTVAIAVGTDGTVTGTHRGQSMMVGYAPANNAVGDSVLIAVASAGGVAVTNDLARFDLLHDTTLTVTVLVDLRSSGEKLGAATMQIAWDPTVLTYVSDADGSSGVGATVNSSGAPNGSLTLSLASSGGFGGVVEIRRITFTVGSRTGASSQLSTYVTELSGAGTYDDLLPKAVVVQHPFVVR